jgi:hypothetical protein
VLLLAVAALPAAMFVLESIPEPDNDTVTGPLFALLATVTVPARDPPAVGLNATFTVQDAPTASDAQLLLCVKSPVTDTPDTVADVVPLLLIVTACEAVELPTTVLAKDKLAGFAFRIGPGATPVPVRLTVLVVPPALTVRVPVRLPAALGLKVTLTEQEPFAGMLVPQVLVWLKSPVAAIEDTAAAEFCGFETVTVCAAEVEPVATPPKFSDPGLAETPSAM